ncbi:DUF2784 domain-containing protein [Paraflavisolibacter sp. H34]|uniref:DUF2784 domain-containing protein n=1 Tax=Huijunlia imazamoxiresistens TaxID=3127457 RepID=UPI0030181461
MLRLFDVLLTIVHLVLIGFNLLGWIWPATRRAHLALVTATAASWFLLGLWFGLGYCPITDWQWQVKEQLGERPLPNSFITYMAHRLTGREFSPALIDTVTLACFVAAVLLSLYFNFFYQRRRKHRHRP